MSERAPYDTRSTALGLGAAAGAVAFALSYLVTYLWRGSSVREQLEGLNALLDLLGGDPVPAWKAVGWLFYNAHGVSFTYPAPGGRVSQNLVSNGDVSMLLYLVPAVVLVLAGFVLARHAGAVDPGDGARVGARVVGGYVVLAVVGLFVFEYSAGGSAVHPEYALGVLLAGVVYPLVFGAVGGVLGAATST